MNAPQSIMTTTLFRYYFSLTDLVFLQNLNDKINNFSQESSDNNISKEPRLMESNDSSILLKSADSKINQGNHSLCSSSSDPSSKFNHEEGNKAS